MRKPPLPATEIISKLAVSDKINESRLMVSKPSYACLHILFSAALGKLTVFSNHIASPSGSV